ncbi:unnamed protein product [Candida verbasci]|uniref:Uncharacterized protein n=1 Tax=Candida verbasci TaxID=1227364 RepID=A0A9W4XD02_9ASCO|nr:unnamed protein product [Candida verbasci]
MSEEKEIAYLDVYIRFNDDQEKDYCFQVNTATKFKDLFAIFKTLPISLRPNVFYNSQPIGFKKSISPGYVTEDGNFLFDEDAMKKVEIIKSNDFLINNEVWPGQLILPIWQFNSFNFYSFISFLLVWLYTDLPDFISPTPGICLTNQITKLLAKIAIYFNQQKIAVNLLEDIENEVGLVPQSLFFVFHILKLLVIFVILWSGVFNPIKVLRLPGSIPKDINIAKEELVKLGWTGTRKATIEEYKEYYREFKINEHGGMIKAHQAGLFNTVKYLGAQLGESEGYNTPLIKENMNATIQNLIEKANEPDFKLKISYNYFQELGFIFAANAENKEGSELAELIKQYRRYGLLVSNNRLKQIVKAKKLQEYPQLKEDLEESKTEPKIEEVK